LKADAFKIQFAQNTKFKNFRLVSLFLYVQIFLVIIYVCLFLRSYMM